MLILLHSIKTNLNCSSFNCMISGLAALRLRCILINRVSTHNARAIPILCNLGYVSLTPEPSINTTTPFSTITRLQRRSLCVAQPQPSIPSLRPPLHNRYASHKSTTIAPCISTRERSEPTRCPPNNTRTQPSLLLCKAKRPLRLGIRLRADHHVRASLHGQAFHVVSG